MCLGASHPPAVKAHLNIDRLGGAGEEVKSFEHGTVLADLSPIARQRTGNVRDAPSVEGDGDSVTVTERPTPPMHHVRVNNSFLAVGERWALQWLVERTPLSATPDHLTLLGLVGALLVPIGFAACHISPWFVSLTMLGLFLNWLGDSLDGTLARHRNIERPDFGYFLDHACDLVSQTLIFIGLGLSPYFTMFSALLALSMYLLMTSFTYLKVLVLKTHHLSYYGMGATELRLLLAVWVLFALWFGPSLLETRYVGLQVIDIAVFAMWSLVFMAFAWKVWTDSNWLRPILDQES